MTGQVSQRFIHQSLITSQALNGDQAGHSLSDNQNPIKEGMKRDRSMILDKAVGHSQIICIERPGFQLDKRMQVQGHVE